MKGFWPIALILLISCGKNAVLKSDNPSLQFIGTDEDPKSLELCEKEPEEIFDELSGEWSSGCQRHTSNGYSMETSYDIDSSGVASLNYKLYRGSNCETLNADLTYNYAIDFDGCVDDTEKIKVNFITVDVLMNSAASNYTNYLNARNECGIGNWQNGRVFDVTGLTCTFLLSGTPYRDNYRSFGEESYGVMLINDEGKLQYGDWKTNSGDSPEERITVLLTHDMFVLSKS